MAEAIEFSKEITPLTNWINPPTVRDLTQNIEDAQSSHDRHILDVNRWEENLSMTGSAKPVKQVGHSAVAPKLIRKQAEWRYSPLSEPFLSTPDLFNIEPTTAGDLKRAHQNQLILNNQFNTKMGKVHFIDEYVRELVDIGTTIIEVSWETEEEEVTSTRPIYEYYKSNNEELANHYMQLLQLRQITPEEFENHNTPGLTECLRRFTEDRELYFAEEIGKEEFTEIKETKNQPVVEICNADNIIIDPSCNGNYKKAGFFVKTFKTSIAELKKDGRYFNLDAINVEGASPLASPDYTEGKDNETFNFADKARKQFLCKMYWGSWDINKDDTTTPILAAWVGDILVRLEKNPFPDQKPPFIVVNYMPVRKSLFGEPDGELLEDNQKISGALTRGMIDLLGRSANGQTGMRKDMLDITNLRKFKRGEDYEFNTTVDPRQGVFTHVYPEIPQSAYNLLSLQNTEAESYTGTRAFGNTGVSGEGLGNTATAVRGALDAASKRELGILRRMATGIIDVGRKIISMNAEWLSEEEVVRVTAEEFVTVRTDDLAGNFDLQLSISTAEGDNQKAQELAFILQTMTKDSDPELYKMVLSEITRLRKMPAISKKIEDFQPTPDPLLQAEQQLKIKLLEAQIAKEQALATKHMAEAGLSDARAQKEGTQAVLNIDKGGTEKAKARQIVADADGKDLDYLEEESGVKHERKLEEINNKIAGDIAVKQIDSAKSSKED